MSVIVCSHSCIWGSALRSDVSPPLGATEQPMRAHDEQPGWTHATRAQRNLLNQRSRGHCDVPDSSMAAQRRGQEPIKLDVPKAAPPPPTTDLPCISALFLIRFDAVKGYAIRWKRALPGLELEGGVEYKCMPSGLHSVNEDLVYFVHGRHAGLNAFVSVPAADEARGALMIAVGVLVPLSYGRLGRSWKHAENLKAFAGYAPSSGG